MDVVYGMGSQKDKNGKQIKDGRVLWPKNPNGRPRHKLFLNEMSKYKTFPSIINDINTGHGTRELNELFETKLFPFPKPYRLLKKFIDQVTKADDIILDFFAGSSTTAHAVMQLNAEDGGKRKFIMVQLPETCDEKSEAFKAGYTNIAEIKERIRRAGKQIKEANATTTADLDIGFRVLKVDSSNVKDVYYTPDAIDQAELALQVDHIKENRSAEDLLFQIMLDWGLDLALPVSTESIEGRMSTGSLIMPLPPVLITK